MTPVVSRRPPPPKQKRHVSRGGLVLLVLLLALLAGVFGATRSLLSRSSGSLASPAPSRSAPPSGTLVAVNVQQGESVVDIARDLQDHGLVPSEAVFVGYVKLHGEGTTFQPGLHQLQAGATMDQIVAELDTPVAAKEIKVTLPEGRRMEEEADLAAQAGVGDKDAFLQLAQHPDPAWNYAFLADRPQGASLEGFLFPDTYQLSASTPKASDLIARMLDTFDKRVTPDVRAKVTAHKRTLYDAIIIASIVEREAKVPQERPLIAGVYWNRLDAKMGLFADPTVQYAIGKPGNWWPQLQDEARKIAPDSPYNTYTHQGLPPGPIANPGLASIQAAADPQGDYLYFVAKNDGSGSHAFAKTLDEHNANRAKYGQ